MLAPGLKLVVCGSAAGTASARAGAYYAGPGNQFWGMLYRVGLTPSQLRPADFRAVNDYAIGLTDIVKTAFGADSDLRRSDFDPGRLRLWVEQHQPRFLAFNGKRSAVAFFGTPVDYGYQAGKDIGATRIYVGPSTSGAARRFWDEDIWRSIAEAVLT